MRGARGRSIVILSIFGWLACVFPAAAQNGPFANWAAIVVAGDWRSHSGIPTPVFDNGRRDIAQQLVAAGFSGANIRQFSVHEPKPGGPLKASLDTIRAQLGELALHTSGGCLLYFTSHGNPDGLYVDDVVMPPVMLAAMVNETCARRPTVVIIAACFSGVFIKPLAGPNRMVLTAARPDRASFGCGAKDGYTYFDACMLKAWPDARDFIALAAAAQACVKRREQDEGVPEASEPQLDIGPALRPMLPLYAFAKPK